MNIKYMIWGVETFGRGLQRVAKDLKLQGDSDRARDARLAALAAEWRDLELRASVLGFSPMGAGPGRRRSRQLRGNRPRNLRRLVERMERANAK